MADKYAVISAGDEGVRIGLHDLGREDKLHSLMVSVMASGVVPDDWAASATSDEDDAATIDVAAPGEGDALVVKMFEACLIGDADDDISLVLEDEEDILWSGLIVNGSASGTRVGFSGLNILCAENKKVTWSATAGGTGCVVVLNLIGSVKNL